MTKRKPVSFLEQLHTQIVASLNAIGFDTSNVFITELGVVIPEANMQISLKTANGKRVWQCVERYSTIALNGDKETVKTVIRFEEPMELPPVMARSIAKYVAEIRIDAALDAIV